MKKVMSILVMGLALCLGWSSMLYAEMAKEGTAEYLAAMTSTGKSLAMGDEFRQINFEGFGVVVNAPPECPLHRASFQIVGGGQAVKGVAKFSALIVWTRLNGEKIYGNLASGGPLKGERKGTITFIGGEGSCKGIQGGVEFTHIGVRPAAKGTRQGLTKAKIHWKIP